jgi:uncharacterized protein YbjT (DUF2867 family)
MHSIDGLPENYALYREPGACQFALAGTAGLALARCQALPLHSLPGPRLKESTMTYVIAGVSGHTGKVAAETLLGLGKSVRVIVRDAAKGEAWKAKGAEVAVADLEDTAALTTALKGAEGAYLLVPPSMEPAFLAYQRRVVDSIAKATEAARVPHAVLLSSVGAEQPEGNGPIRGIYYAENQFKKSNVTKWTFLRAAYFIENIGGSLGMLDQGLLPAFGDSKGAFPMVATRDIGETAARLLVEGATKTEAVNVSSGTYSFADAAATLSKILGKTINVAEAPIEVMAETLKGFGIPAELAGLYQEMTGNMLLGKITPEPQLRSFKGSTTIETVLRGILGK